jgi:HPt (histidine-containing phosphotransfer) domain-containing protein
MSEGATKFDEQAALARVAGDHELLCDIAGIYLEGYADLLQAVRNAIAAADAGRLEAAAHLIKGTVANFEAIAASELAFELERMGAEGALAGADARADELAREVEMLADELEAYRERQSGASR